MATPPDSPKIATVAERKQLLKEFTPSERVTAHTIIRELESNWKDGKTTYPYIPNPKIEDYIRDKYVKLGYYVDSSWNGHKHPFVVYITPPISFIGPDSP